MTITRLLPIIITIISFLALPVLAASGEESHNLNVGWHWGGLLCIGIFILSYAAVLVEEFTHMRKSKPVMLGAG